MSDDWVYFTERITNVEEVIADIKRPGPHHLRDDTQAKIHERQRELDDLRFKRAMLRHLDNIHYELTRKET